LVENIIKSAFECLKYMGFMVFQRGLDSISFAWDILKILGSFKLYKKFLEKIQSRFY